jgi:hypothetical protein
VDRLLARQGRHGIGFCQRQQTRHELFRIDPQLLAQLGGLPAGKSAGLPGYGLQNEMGAFRKFKQFRLKLLLAVGHHQRNSSTLLAVILA